MTKTNNQDLKLHDSNGDLSKRWYISYTYYSEKEKKRKRVKIYLGLNFQKTVLGRMRESKNIFDFVNKQLSDGWDPDVISLDDFITSENSTKINEMTFGKSLVFSLEKGKDRWATKTYYCYKTSANAFGIAAKKIGIYYALLEKIGRREVKLLLDEAKRKNGWSNSAVNKHLSYLKALMSILTEYEFIEQNPCKLIKTLPVAESKHYESLTNEEKKKISDILILRHYRFYVYLMVIYYTGIRPKEVLALRIRDINMPNREIVIRPDLKEENSKTKKERFVPIAENLYLYFAQLSIEEENKDFYLFGAAFKHTGSEMIRKRSPSTDPEQFSPSPFKIRRDTATNLWAQLIMASEDNGGLGICKNMYAMKHTGADDYILSGVNIEALKSMFGHSSLLMTERYISKLKDVYKDEIRKHAPTFGEEKKQ